MTTTSISDTVAGTDTDGTGTDTSTAVATATPIGRLRAVVCAGTILATVPYLTLKMAWISGAHWGVHGDSMDTSFMQGANTVTVLMDLVAAVIALALVRPWGRRLPAPVLVFPMWVATGFLGPILLVAPLAAAVGSLSGDNGRSAGAPPDTVAGWVYGMVYGGFGLQGIGLLIGFILYARSRWAGVFHMRMRDLPGGPGFAAHRALAAGVGLFSLVPIGFHLYWAAGGTGLRPGDDRTWLDRLVSEAGFGLLPLAGTVALLVLAWQRTERPARAVLAVGWLGTGAMFSWGFWWLIASSLSNPLSHGEDMRGLGLVGGFGMLAGAVLATVLGLTVVEAVRRASAAEIAG